MQSIGLIEVYGITAAINAADAMCKGAGVTLSGYKKIGSARVTVYVCGEVAAVQIAVQNGVEAASRVSQVFASLVIPRPDQSVIDSLNTLGQKSNKPKSFLHKKSAFASKAKTAAETDPAISTSEPAIVTEKENQLSVDIAEVSPVSEKTVTEPEQETMADTAENNAGKKTS